LHRRRACNARLQTGKLARKKKKADKQTANIKQISSEHRANIEQNNSKIARKNLKAIR